MRETCARVLAAALMTGAIATVVGMSAVLGTPSESSRPITAPGSSLQRAVRLTAQPARRHRRTAARLVTAHTIHAQPRSEVVTRSLVVVRPHRVRRQVQHRQLAAAKPPPVAPPAPAVVPAPAPAEPARPTTGEDTGNGDDSHPGHGHGHEHGHGRSDQDE